MQPFNSTIQEQVAAFHQRINTGERFYREAVAALAVEQAMRGFEQKSEPRLSPGRRLLGFTGRLLVRGGQWLVALAEPRQTTDPLTRQWEVSDTNPIIVDVEAKPIGRRSRQFRRRAHSLQPLHGKVKPVTLHEHGQ